MSYLKSLGMDGRAEKNLVEGKKISMSPSCPRLIVISNSSIILTCQSRGAEPVTLPVIIDDG